MPLDEEYEIKLTFVSKGEYTLSENEYTALVECSNCDLAFIVVIKKGFTISSVVHNVECPNCGCHTISRRK